MHAKPDLRVFLKWMIARSGSVITDVIRLGCLLMKRLFRPRFGLRFLLLVLLFLSVGLGYLARLDYEGRQRLSAVNTLRGYGAIVLEQRQEGDIHTGSLTIYSGAAPPWDVEFSSVKPYEHYEDGFLRFLIGDAVFAEHTILILHRDVSATAEELQIQISKLPKLETIRINQDEIGRPLINELESRNPDIEFRINSIGIHPQANMPEDYAE